MAAPFAGATGLVQPELEKAVGFTINHIAAVVLPVIGGLLWVVDYRIPFVAGSILSLISLIAVQYIKIGAANAALD